MRCAIESVRTLSGGNLLPYVKSVNKRIPDVLATPSLEPFNVTVGRLRGLGTFARAAAVAVKPVRPSALGS